MADFCLEKKTLQPGDWNVLESMFMPSGRRLLHEIDCAGTLDLTSYFPMHPGRNTSNTARKNFPGLRGEFDQNLRIFVGNFFCGQIKTAAGQLAVGLAEIDEALFGFWFHDGKVLCWRSADFTVQGAPVEEGVELDFLQTVGREDTLLVARGDVARRRLAFAAGYGAFNSDNFSGHSFGGVIKWVTLS